MADRPVEPRQPTLGPPPHNVGWAVAAVLFFWPLAFSAFTHAFNVYPLWAQGDFVGAKAASDRVRRLGVLSLWLCGGLLLVLGILYAVFIIVMISQGYGHHFHGGGMWHRGH